MRKTIGQITDVLMYGLLLAQMLYVFTGNNVHEILGVGFFLCFAVHQVLKARWYRSLFRRGKPASARAFDLVTLLLLLSCAALMLSSMGVSRFLFPRIRRPGSTAFHRWMATAVLALSVLHGGMHAVRRAKAKRVAAALTGAACVAAIAVGAFAVPYMNRHFRKVEVDFSDAVTGERVDWDGQKPLVVYFTRFGNTEFGPDADAVSSASLLIADGERMGSNRLVAEMAGDILGCDPVAITLTGQKYPGSYNATVSAAGRELRAQARPDIEPIDVTGYDSVILIYPLWWGSIPMPVATFLERNAFDGKTLYLIATQGSSGYGSSVSETEALCPGAAVVPGASIYCEDIPDAREELLGLIREWNERTPSAPVGG